MVGRYIDDDPAFALEHARYAVSRAGRVAAVREAAAVAAYVNEEFHEALKEFRTYRRITGDDAHLPLMVDCERALGRPEKALELATSEAVAELPSAAKVELAIVVAGMRRDEGDADGALRALEIPQLQRNRGFSYSPRLFRAYAEALRGVGREAEARPWDRQAVVAEAALGTGQFEDPEIVDLIGDDEELDTGVELDSADAMQGEVDRVSADPSVEGTTHAGSEKEPTAAGAEADGLVVETATDAEAAGTDDSVMAGARAEAIYAADAEGADDIDAVFEADALEDRDAVGDNAGDEDGSDVDGSDRNGADDEASGERHDV